MKITEKLFFSEADMMQFARLYANGRTTDSEFVGLTMREKMDLYIKKYKIRNKTRKVLKQNDVKEQTIVLKIQVETV